MNLDLKKLWARRPRLPRGWKTARNLAFVLAVVLAAPFLLRWPPWSARAAFRQLEGQYILPQSEILLEERYYGSSSFLAQSEGLVITGKVTKLASGGSFWGNYSADLCQLLPREGLVAAALPGPDGDGALVVAVTGLSQGTAAGELEVDLFGLDRRPGRGQAEDETFTAQAQADGDGWLIFRLLPHQGHGEDEVCAMEAMWQDLSWWEGAGGWPYRLRLLDSGGGTLSACSGALPEDQEYLSLL